MEKDVLLRITDYVVEFKTENGTKQAINHLNLTIHKGESLGLVGGRPVQARQQLHLVYSDCFQNTLPK